MRALILFVLFASAVAYSDDPYPQVFAARYTFKAVGKIADWHVAPFSKAVDIVICNSSTLVLDGSFIWSLEENKIVSGPFSDNPVRLTCTFVVSATAITNWKTNQRVAMLNVVKVNDVFEWQNGLFVAHDHGLLFAGNGSAHAVSITSFGLDNSTVKVKSVSASGSSVAIGTEWSLFTSEDSLESLYYDRVPGIIDLGGCNSLSFSVCFLCFVFFYLP